MRTLVDSIDVQLWSAGDGMWGVQLRHQQDGGIAKGTLERWSKDVYDWAGEGAMTDLILSEISTCALELLGYSVERVAGLQLALF